MSSLGSCEGCRNVAVNCLHRSHVPACVGTCKYIVNRSLFRDAASAIGTHVAGVVSIDHGYGCMTRNFGHAQCSGVNKRADVSRD